MSPTARSGVGPVGTEWAERAKIYAYRDYMLVEQRDPFVQQGKRAVESRRMCIDPFARSDRDNFL